MDAEFKKQLEEAVKSYMAEVDADLAKTPFGVPPSLGTWGGSAQVADLGVRMYFLHKAFPRSSARTTRCGRPTTCWERIRYRALRIFPRWVTVSKMKAYGNNRADGTFIPGGMIPGYIIIKPDFPECIDDFGFLWFEDEYTISVTAKWILAANAADALVK